jgi:hypothetical protein
MADRDPRLDTFLYHQVDIQLAEKMGQLRQNYYWLAQLVTALCPSGRSQSLALTALEESAMRAIQAIAMQGTPQPLGE